MATQVGLSDSRPAETFRPGEMLMNPLITNNLRLR